LITNLETIKKINNIEYKIDKASTSENNGGYIVTIKGS
jgi:hypothetical protein